MWILTNLVTDSIFYVLNEKSKYVVGRAGADFVLKDDSSISRSHATIQLLPTSNSLTLIDLGSKYGTYHNEGIESNKKLENRTEVELRNGDRIRFGLLKNEWKLSRKDIVTMMSSLPKAKSAEVERYLKALGGRVISQWDLTCTHLTMTEITVTVKVLHALIEQIPIVTCEYWRDYLEAVRQGGGKALPSTDAYLPQPIESFLNQNKANFGFNSERKTLFSGKTFVFMNKRHYDMYAPIVQKAGGACKDLKSGVQKTFLTKKNVIVIQYVASSQSQSSQTINSISDYLEANSLRVVPEYEIGLAVVNCSTEKFCNPSYKIVLDLMPNSVVNDLEYDTLFVENTRTNSKAPTNTMNNMEIPETDKINPGYSAAFCTRGLEKITDFGIIEIEESQAVPASANALNVIENVPNELNTAKTEAEIADDNEPIHMSKRKKRANIIDDNDSYPIPKKTILEMDKEHVDEYDDQPQVSSEEDSLEATQKFVKSAGKRNFNDSEEENLYNANQSIAPPPKIQKLSKDPDKIKDVTQTKSIAFAKETPINAVALTTQKTSLNTFGFLRKSQIQSSQQEEDCSEISEPKKSEPQKRGRIAIITDDDSDDENDLFNFGGGSGTSKRSRLDNTLTVANNPDSDDELFGFTKTPNQKDAFDNDVTTVPEPFVQRSKAGKSVTPNTYAALRPKIVPIKISSEGWLSRSLNQMNLKAEKTEVKVEDDSAESTLHHQQYIESLKGGFEVRLRCMNITTHSKDLNQSVVTATSKTSSIDKTAKNFKAFVKKCNYKPQQKVLPTVSMPIINIR